MLKKYKLEFQQMMVWKIDYLGEKWEPLTPPEKNIQGIDYSCENPPCYLHLHSFTERTDSLDKFSSSFAKGMLIGVGNVGNELSKYNDGDTFFSRDLGQTWKEIAEDAHMFEISNRGNIILLVNDEGPTETVK